MFLLEGFILINNKNKFVSEYTCIRKTVLTNDGSSSYFDYVSQNYNSTTGAVWKHV